MKGEGEVTAVGGRQVVLRREVPEAELPPDLHPLLARIYRARNVRSVDDLARSLDALYPYATLRGIADAVALLVRAVQEGRRILVVGDFDADGATSTALALRALRAMGAAHVDFLVPNRFEYGYGLTPEIVAVAAGRHPDLIVTVDNGISSLAGVAAARATGIQVLITDHHLPGERLPEADAIVNPNQPGDEFPSKHLAGVGVIFYVMSALRAALREHGWFAARGMLEPNLAQWLDLVALGTVADVVPLDRNNRILVAQGVARIRAGQACPGILALLQAAGRDPARITASDLGFAAAPRLNAAGRLEDMALGIECLLSDTPETAHRLAQRLDELNSERRAIEADMKQQALAHIERMLPGAGAAELPRGLCLFQEDWHEGVIGILAARIKDRWHRPVIAFAPSADADVIKGSARSVPGLHVRDALDAIAARHPGLISKFGGHAMAAGLTIRRSDFAAFATAFDVEVGRHLSREDLRGVLWSDGELPATALTLELADLLRGAGPWGQGFTEPLFDGEFELVQRRRVGQGHLKLVLRPVGGAALLDAIAFNTSDAAWSRGVRRVRLAYRLDVNEYQGRRAVQLRVEYLETV